MFSQINIRHILSAGIVLRLLAVFFSPGYAFYDDHFAVVELANEWTKGNISEITGEGVYVFSLLYPGIHYLLITVCNSLGISDPEGIMLVVRLFHAAVSVAGIYFGWRLASLLTANKETPLIVATLLAVFWLFPFLSVRSLREFFCIPFLLAGSYYSIKEDSGNKSAILSALFFSVAVVIRLQCIIFPLVAGVYWLFNRGQFKKALVFGLAFSTVFFLSQGLFDWIYYGNPLASTLEYFRYNADAENINNYPRGPWFQYVGTVAGMVLLIPFFILAAGYFYSVKISREHKILFVSSLIFFLFHSVYANKQERFILPFLPYFIILGVLGFAEIKKAQQKKWISGAVKFSVGWFVVLNTILLFVLTFSYSKRSRVEAMNYLRKKADVTGIIMEGPDNKPPPPLFYLGKRVDVVSMNVLLDSSGVAGKISQQANYVIFVGSSDLVRRTTLIKNFYPDLQEEKVITPGFLDNLAHRANPKHNRNESWIIYRVN